MHGQAIQNPVLTELKFIKKYPNSEQRKGGLLPYSFGKPAAKFSSIDRKFYLKTMIIGIKRETTF